ncbi:MAG: ROK family protein, partial [Hyphomicrobiales bacterium]|nr:ROK family protein [Hyphomicrobiales bacterium]
RGFGQSGRGRSRLQRRRRPEGSAEIARCAAAADEAAVRTVRSFARELSKGMVALVNIFNPTTIILGGLMSPILELCLDDIRSRGAPDRPRHQGPGGSALGPWDSRLRNRRRVHRTTTCSISPTSNSPSAIVFLNCKTTERDGLDWFCRLGASGGWRAFLAPREEPPAPRPPATSPAAVCSGRSRS